MKLFTTGQTELMLRIEAWDGAKSGCILVGSTCHLMVGLLQRGLCCYFYGAN